MTALLRRVSAIPLPVLFGVWLALYIVARWLP